MLFVWHAALQKLASMDSTATNSSNLNSAATKDTGSMLMTLLLPTAALPLRTISYQTDF